MEAIVLIIGCLVQGVTISVLYGYERELRDGMSTSRFFPWVIQWMSLNLVATPLYVLFPQAALALNLAYYSSLAVISVLNYAFSVFHKNQIRQNSGQDPQLTLPFDLHNNELFKNIVSALTPRIYLGLGAIYALSLGLTVMLAGAYFSVACILGAILLDQVYQWEWFPSFLQQPLQLLRLALLSSWVFGFDSWISIGLTTFNLTVFVWNFISIQLRGERSPTCHFNIAEAEHEFSFAETLDDVKPSSSQQLKQLLNHLKPALSVRITYNHFRDSALATQKLLANAPVLNNAEYSRLFNKLDFNKPNLRELIVNQMAVHDKFHEKSLEQRRIEFNLPTDCEDAEIHIAFLKKEMEHLVERLNHPSASRSINHEQRITMCGQARRVLEHLLQHEANVDQQERILLNLALRTGSHCSRIYLETFAEICNSLHFETAELSLRERTVLAAQVLRDEQYKKYYYFVMKNLYGFIDLNDYHSYENFVAYYGMFFYLQNQSLQNRYPDGIDLLADRGYYYFLKAMGQPVFAEYYNEGTLIESVTSGLLHPLFQLWCEEFYEGAYDQWVLDEYSSVKENAPDVLALAKLFLLDLGLVELTQPLAENILAQVKPSSHRGPLQNVLKARNTITEAMNGEHILGVEIDALPQEFVEQDELETRQGLGLGVAPVW